MEQYDYESAVRADVEEYLENEVDLSQWVGDREGLEELLNEELWINDSVTGNASGSYTFNTWEAEENLAHNRDLFQEMAQEFGSSLEMFVENPEAADVSIRCYLLGGVIAEILDELESEGIFEEKEENVDDV